MAARQELFYDTETALRLVDGEVRAMTDVGPHGGPTDVRLSGLAALPLVLERANDEIQAVLGNLRDSRAALDALETTTVGKLQQTSDKLREVTSATEVATSDILDALDRAGTTVDELEQADNAGDKSRSAELRDALRGEIFGMMGALQFQDITAQQLAYAASVLTEMQGRLLMIAKLFDPDVVVRGSAFAPDPQTFDPGATTRHADRRQALANEVFLLAR